MLLYIATTGESYLFGYLFAIATDIESWKQLVLGAWAPRYKVVVARPSFARLLFDLSPPVWKDAEFTFQKNPGETNRKNGSVFACCCGSVFGLGRVSRRFDQERGLAERRGVE